MAGKMAEWPRGTKRVEAVDPPVIWQNTLVSHQTGERNGQFKKKENLQKIGKTTVLLIMMLRTEIEHDKYFFSI